jgi:hypothetical protein
VSKPSGEPRGDKIVGLLSFALIAPEAGETGGKQRRAGGLQVKIGKLHDKDHFIPLKDSELAEIDSWSCSGPGPWILKSRRADERKRAREARWIGFWPTCRNWRAELKTCAGSALAENTPLPTMAVAKLN